MSVWVHRKGRRRITDCTHPSSRTGTGWCSGASAWAGLRPKPCWQGLPAGGTCLGTLCCRTPAVAHGRRGARRPLGSQSHRGRRPPGRRGEHTREVVGYHLQRAAWSKKSRHFGYERLQQTNMHFAPPSLQLLPNHLEGVASAAPENSMPPLSSALLVPLFPPTSITGRSRK